MIDLKLDLTTNDIIFQNGDISFTAPGQESLAQRLNIKLRFFMGEWFLNMDFGIPYFQQIFVKPVVQYTIDAIFKSQILETPGVLELTSYTSSFDNVSRTFTLSFEVISEQGDSLDFQIPITI